MKACFNPIQPCFNPILTLFAIEFASIGASVMTVMRSVLGDFPIIELEGTNAVLARVLFISYMIVLFFIVLNMFIAVLSEVAHVYSLQPSLEEYREWFKMKMLLKEMFCCCFGYGQDGNSVVDEDDDDEADIQACLNPVLTLFHPVFTLF